MGNNLDNNTIYKAVTKDTGYSVFGSKSDIDGGMPYMDPTDVIKKMIMDILDPNHTGEVQKGLGTFALFYVMFLMQEFGQARVSVQADLQTHMNKYMDDIKVIWKTFYESNTSVKDPVQPFQDFHAAMTRLEERLKSDPFFAKGGPGESMRYGIEMTLQSIREQTNGQGMPQPLNNPLWYMWAEFDPSLKGQTGQGNSSYVDNFTRTVGQLQTEITSQNEAVAQNTKIEVKNWEAEQQNLTNIMKALQHQIETIIRQSVTR